MHTHAPTLRKVVCVRNTLSNLTILYFCILNQFQRVDLSSHTVLSKLYVRTIDFTKNYVDHSYASGQFARAIVTISMRQVHLTIYKKTMFTNISIPSDIRAS